MKPQLYWIDGGSPGRLALLPRPRGGEWLEDEVRAWKNEKIDIVLSLLTEEEMEELGLEREAALCAADGLEYISFPIDDHGVPDSTLKMRQLATKMAANLAEGKSLAIHCRAAIGRSAVVAATILSFGGMDVGTAFQKIAAARGCPVPDTDEQRQWVENFAKARSHAGGRTHSA